MTADDLSTGELSAGQLSADELGAAGRSLTYTAGSNVTLVAPGAALIFAEPPSGETVARCWPLIRDRAGVAAIIESLVDAGLRALGGFALLCADGTGCRLVVRSPGRARSTGVDGQAEVIDADALATWVERRLDHATASVTMGIGRELIPPAAARDGHPLVGGTVLAGTVTMILAPTESAPIPTAAPTPAPMPLLPVSTGITVQAVACPYNHLGPPYEPYCRVCGTAIEDTRPFLAERPPLGLLRLSTGDVVPLDRGVIMGRNPRAVDEHDAKRPHLVRLPSPDNDVSRTHVEIRLEDWHVLAVDLASTNGTTVTIPGQAPIRLRPHEPMPLEPNAEVNLADEIVFRYEVPTA